MGFKTLLVVCFALLFLLVQTAPSPRTSSSWNQTSPTAAANFSADNSILLPSANLSWPGGKQPSSEGNHSLPNLALRRAREADNRLDAVDCIAADLHVLSAVLEVSQGKHPCSHAAAAYIDAIVIFMRTNVLVFLTLAGLFIVLFSTMLEVMLPGKYVLIAQACHLFGNLLVWSTGCLWLFIAITLTASVDMAYWIAALVAASLLLLMRASFSIALAIRTHYIWGCLPFYNTTIVTDTDVKLVLSTRGVPQFIMVALSPDGFLSVMGTSKRAPPNRPAVLVFRTWFSTAYFAAQTVSTTASATRLIIFSRTEQVQPSGKTSISRVKEGYHRLKTPKKPEVVRTEVESLFGSEDIPLYDSPELVTASSSQPL